MQNPENEIREVPHTKQATKATKRGTKGLCWHAFWPGLALACLIVPALPLFGGCDMIVHAPEPEPAPTKVPDVPPHPDRYTPAPADTAVIKPMTDNDPKDNGGKNLIPDFYQLVSAETGDRLTLQAYRIPLTADGKEGVPYTVPHEKPIKVKLGGIICPLKGEKGWAEATATTENWLRDRRLQVDRDAKYPYTLDFRNIVQIRIDSDVKTKGPDGNVTVTKEIRPFNQLLVRAGYAFVDLVSPTSFDYKPWIIDEEYARGIRSEPAPWQKEVAGQPTPKPAPGNPVGLWARGIYPYPDFRPGPPLGPKSDVIGDVKVVQGAKDKKKVAKVTKVTKETVIKTP